MQPHLKYCFDAKSVAIIGASRNPGKIGYVVLENFVKGNFKGKVYPINPDAKEILQVKCFSSVAKVPHDIELAVICVPAALVPQVIEECGEKKIRAAVIISAGFHEVGNEDLTRQLEAAKAKYPQLAVIGPNCLGILDTYTGIDTLFLPRYRLTRPKKGKISFISQSGALGSAVLDWAGSKDYGISKFISYGNAMFVDETDLMEFLAADKDTEVIAIYAEGIRNGRKFFQAAKKITPHKPIIVIKGGLSEAGSKATASHTGSLAGSAQVFDAVMKQTGLIQANSMEEVFDFARVLASEPLPDGKRVQIITNGGGYGVLTADAISFSKLELAQMQEKFRKPIIAASPSYAVIKNPMDLTGDADNNRFMVALQNALLDAGVDSIILIILFQVPTLDSDIIEGISGLLRNRTKPVLVISVGGEFAQMHMHLLEREGINTFNDPTAAARAMHALTYYADKH
jgi:acetyl coenzyme A synthetase (ADP forming)-like protein